MTASTEKGGKLRSIVCVYTISLRGGVGNLFQQDISSLRPVDEPHTEVLRSKILEGMRLSYILTRLTEGWFSHQSHQRVVQTPPTQRKQHGGPEVYVRFVLQPVFDMFADGAIYLGTTRRTSRW